MTASHDFTLVLELIQSIQTEIGTNVYLQDCSYPCYSTVKIQERLFQLLFEMVEEIVDTGALKNLKKLKTSMNIVKAYQLGLIVPDVEHLDHIARVLKESLAQKLVSVEHLISSHLINDPPHFAAIIDLLKCIWDISGRTHIRRSNGSSIWYDARHSNEDIQSHLHSILREMVADLVEFRKLQRSDDLIVAMSIVKSYIIGINGPDMKALDILAKQCMSELQCNRIVRVSRAACKMKCWFPCVQITCGFKIKTVKNISTLN
jgi:hypothetical protein